MSTAPAQKAALISRLRDLYPDAGVSYAMPSTFPNDCVYLGAVRVENAMPTEGGQRRSRREAVSLSVVFSCYRPGLSAGNGSVSLAEDAAVSADEAAFAMVARLEDDFRDRSRDLLDGLVMTAIVSDLDVNTEPVADERGAVIGYVCELTAIITTTATI